MKNILIMVLVLCCVRMFGQYTYTDTVHHLTVTGYGGVLAGPKLSVTNGTSSAIVSVRLGGDITWKPLEWLSCYGLGAGEIDETGTMIPFALLGVTLHPHRKINIMLGKIATPMTVLRPLPITGIGQFETWTQARIPGPAAGGKITYTATERFAITAGGFWRSTDATIELGIKVPYTKIAGYYRVREKTFGAAFTCRYKLFSTTLAYNHRHNASMMQTLEIPKAKGFSLYSDIGFDTDNGDLLRGEWGGYIPLKIKFINLLFGAGYDHVQKTINGYVFLYL